MLQLRGLQELVRGHWRQANTALSQATGFLTLLPSPSRHKQHTLDLNFFGSKTKRHEFTIRCVI